MMADLSKLKHKFEPKDIEWRVGQCGFKKDGKPWAIILPYIDSRAVMERLDEVIGPDKWSDSYEHIVVNSSVLGVKAKIRIKCGDEWIEKEDGSQETDMEPFKGGFSKAFVRCAVKWGIGRYLYDLPITFATFVDYKNANTVTSKVKDRDGKEGWFTWVKPSVEEKPPISPPTPAQLGKIKETVTPADKPELAQQGNLKDEPRPNCKLCGTKMMLSNKGLFWFCPNFKDKKNGDHPIVHVTNKGVST